MKIELKNRSFPASSSLTTYEMIAKWTNDDESNDDNNNNVQDGINQIDQCRVVPSRYYRLYL